MNTSLRLALAAVSVLAVSSAEAQPKPEEPLLLPLAPSFSSMANWLTPPSGEDLEREYPPVAQMLELPGGATMSCVAEVDGHVDQCRIVSEWPAGLGFGAAAVRSARYFVMKPAIREGAPVPSSVVIPLKFQLDMSQVEAAAASPAPSATTTSPEALTLARQIVELEGTSARIKTGWLTMMDRLGGSMVARGEGQDSARVLDALRGGVEDNLPAITEAYAHNLAARMTIADLQATVAFMRSPAGAAFADAQSSPAADVEGRDLYTKIVHSARARLCAQVDCHSPSGAAKG